MKFNTQSTNLMWVNKSDYNKLKEENKHLKECIGVYEKAITENMELKQFIQLFKKFMLK